MVGGIFLPRSDMSYNPLWAEMSMLFPESTENVQRPGLSRIPLTTYFEHFGFPDQNPFCTVI